ncbi:hypothetical protein COX53_01320 [candidate division WWE3 bacterium CG23_combo_of_CG06-09_8_20_14_all_40_14]|uniref:Prepilin peptidase n=1 Tax=candidate division WWE3 bacterium CG23_combo_of_CG06-09_8_20_14_all_40_14 TaxID=1975095 RepID=A0A2G9XCE3_UNCKA|nr:MAG: hypothetical protein COX53_01320 [candidate division WWE3 bacterium CG23_combo_of_CG06-09_8_20_14_all_40_14]
MTFFIYLYIFLIGACAGSFLNVVIDRFPKRQKLIKSRSICPFCKTPLSFRDLLPIVSFVLLGGKCRYCKKKIDKTLPLVEILAGVMFILVMSIDGGIGGVGIVEKLYYLAIFSVLLAVFFMDLKYGVIEDKLVLAGVFIWGFYTVFSKAGILYFYYTSLRGDAFGKYLIKAGFLNSLFVRELKEVFLSLLCAVILFLFFYFLAFITRGRGIGGGDVKFAFLMGLILGFPKIIPAFFLSFLTGALVSLILILLRKKTIKQTVPFGPFLVFGAVLGLLFGEGIVSWYLKFL